MLRIVGHYYQMKKGNKKTGLSRMLGHGKEFRAVEVEEVSVLGGDG